MINLNIQNDIRLEDAKGISASHHSNAKLGIKAIDLILELWIPCMLKVEELI